MATAIGEPPIVEVDAIGNVTRASLQQDDTTDAPPLVETSDVVCDVNFENHVDGQEDTLAATADTADEESPTDGLVDGDKKKTSTNESSESNHDAEEDEESEEDVESEDGGIDMFPEPHEFNTDSLYKLYVERLKYQQEWKSSGQETKESKAPKMVRGIVDYVRTLEDRIQELESSEARRSEREKEKERQQTDDETGVGRSKPSDAVNEWPQVVLEIKLFHVDGEFDRYGNWQNNRFKKGSYQCTLETNSLIRALYSWTEGVTPPHIHQQPLDPEHTDILIFGIMSKPVASFFRDRLGIGDNSTLLSMRIGKPFRPLIRNLQPVRDQLGKLEEKYRVADPKTPTDEPKANDATENDTAAKQDGVLPFPATLEDGKKEPEGYETKEALLHFRMLLEFVEKYLHEKVTLFDRLKKGLEDKIAFEDLWMLFDTGDTIYSPYVEGGVVLKHHEESHTTKTRYVPQAFRVLSTAGGLPWRRTLAPKQSDPGDDILGNPFFSKWPIKGLRHAALPEMQDGIPSAQRNKDKFAPLHVVCFNIDFNGVKYGPVHEIFSFRPYDGLVDITSLEAYPIQYLKTQPGRFPGGDEQPEEDSLLQRGRKFIDATAVSHLSHEGLSVGKSRHEINSAVIVDFKLSFQEYVQEFPDHENIVPSFTPAAVSMIIFREAPVIEFYIHQCGDSWCHGNGCVFEAYGAFQLSQIRHITPRIKALLEEDETVKLTKKESLQKFKKYMEDNDLIRLLPGVVPGFALRNRKWVQLDLDQLEELKQEDEWKKLVLPDGHREMVQAMVETHTRGSQDSKWVHNTPKAKVQMDLVQGKGRGCIILLHGVPGVGKTSTAECVAAHTRRPLYPITCGRK
ncbi:AAA family ATPase [Ilyonectria robusta]